MKTIAITGFNKDKYEAIVPDTADTFLEKVNDKVDGESHMLIVKDGQRVIAQFSGIMSFYVTDVVQFKILAGSKDFV